jgi:hypothetical protein
MHSSASSGAPTTNDLFQAYTDELLPEITIEQLKITIQGSKFFYRGKRMFNRSLTRSVAILATTACLLCLSPSTLAQEEPPEVEEDDSINEGERCISSRPVRKTEVLDDQNIIFYMSGRAIYLNHLPKPCKKLAQTGRFMYRTTVARLCRSDIITILHDTGLGLGKGRSCKLGTFYGITDEDVEKIKAPREIEPNPVPPAEPEEPGTEQTEASDQTEGGEQTAIEED